ncbi:hypothetical protein ACQZ5G_14820 [Agrobacterium sp. 22-214-1]
MRKVKNMTAAAAIATIAGCTSAEKFPLCPAIAANSYAVRAPDEIINSYVRQQAKDRGLTISPISSFAAEISGPAHELKWMKDNYKHMLCAFNPKVEIDDRATYLSCMSHADEWVRIVQSEHSETLLVSQTLFKENCVRSGL